MTVQSKNDTVMKGTDVFVTYESRNARLARVSEYIRNHPEATYQKVMHVCHVTAYTALKANEMVRPGVRMPSDPPKKRPITKPKKPVELTHEQRRERKREMLEYARQNPNASAMEIAELFGLRDKTASCYLSSAGLGKGRNINNQFRDPGRYMRNDPQRIAILKQGIEEDWTLKEIGKLLGVTRERSRQLIKIFQAIYPEVQRPKHYTMEDVSVAMGVSRNIVRRLAKENGLGRLRGEDTFCFFEAEVDTLSELIEEYATHQCEVCGNYFERVHQNARHCSGKCRVKGFAIRLCQPNKDNRKAYQWGEVTERVKRSKKKPTRWLSWAEARDLAGVTSMQLVYLRKKGIVRTRPTPSGENRQGTVYTEYALEDMKIVKDFKGRPAR